MDFFLSVMDFFLCVMVYTVQ